MKDVVTNAVSFVTHQQTLKSHCVTMLMADANMDVKVDTGSPCVQKVFLILLYPPSINVKNVETFESGGGGKR